jgi:cyclopropane fatty-acyl-phospholipid synthase-like methyltransferase
MIDALLHRSQLFLSELLRRKSFTATRLDDLDEEGREAVYQKGYAQIATLAQRLERQTGFSLEGARALDFGCGVGRNVLPLAERCEHVYALDVSPAVLREGSGNAQRRGLENIDWLDASKLPELDGRYDLAISFFVFQHIPSREGERVFATLVRGLRPGGAGAIHVTLRPRLRNLTWAYPYALMNSYSLSRLGRLLTDAGVTEWHTRLHAGAKPDGVNSANSDVTIIFRKP